MSNLRLDQFTTRQVIVVEGRGSRPRDYQVETGPTEERKRVPDCPFCEGNESETPPEVWALRDGKPNSARWQIRVIPNKFPVNATHELIIESPYHNVDLPELTSPETARLMECYQRRIRALEELPNVRHVLLFKNYGYLAGATRVHPHVQIVGNEAIPPLIQEEARLATNHFKSHGSCIYCQMIDDELNIGERIIVTTANFVALSPYASRFPYELWILPRHHNADFVHEDTTNLLEMGELLKSSIHKLRFIHADRDWAYNFYIHSAPHLQDSSTEQGQLNRSYHWHLELFPRITTPAGLEWGAGVYVNSVSPESAAATLRQLKT